MTSVLRARGPADLIALVPVLLGFRPRESLVAIVSHGPRSQLGFRLRIDLPPLEHVDAAADQVVDYLVKQSPDEVLLLAFSDRPDVCDPLVSAVRTRLRSRRVRLQDALRCDGARYWSYVCDNEQCCPSEGTPYDDRSNVMLAEAVFHGVEILPDREDLVQRYQPARGRTRKRMRAATRSAVAEFEKVAAVERPQTDPDVLRVGLDKVRAIVDEFESGPGRVLTDKEVAALSVWTSLIIVRDYLWARITRSTADDHLVLWTQVAGRVVEPFEPATLSLTAFAAWLSGNGSTAQCALDRVADVDPGYSMAALIQTALTGCLDPRSWEGIDIDEVMRSVPGLI